MIHETHMFLPLYVLRTKIPRTSYLISPLPLFYWFQKNYGCCLWLRPIEFVLNLLYIIFLSSIKGFGYSSDFFIQTFSQFLVSIDPSFFYIGFSEVSSSTTTVMTETGDWDGTITY